MSSTSKIKKIIDNIKNRIEKGRRAEVLGVNPHSNGLDFSRRREALVPNTSPRDNKRKENSIIIKDLTKMGNLRSRGG